MVPLLLVALFVESHDVRAPTTSWRRRWEQIQDKAYALLAVAAFFTSLFVASDVIAPSAVTTALVITALSGTMTLLLLQIWRRLDRRRPQRDAEPRP